jgi:hypothetical protein
LRAPDHDLGAETMAIHRALGLLRIAHGWSGLRSNELGQWRVLLEARSLMENVSHA